MFEDAGNIWDNAEQLATEAFDHYENGRMSQAYRQLREAIDINPSNPAWLFNAGLTLDAMGKFDEAIELYEQALEMAGDDPEILNCIAVDYTRNGMYDKSLEIFEQIEQIDPEFEPGYCNRIITYAEMDKHDKAEEMFYLAQYIKDDCPICFYNIGNSLFTRREYARAAWCWEKTAEIDEEHPQINYRIAQAYWAQGNIKIANSHFLQELRNNPGDMDIVMEYGIFLLLNGDMESAREKFARVLEMEPDNARAMLYMGDIELENGNVEGAERWYRKSQKNDLCLSGPCYRMAQLAIRRDDKEAAIEHIKEEMLHNVEDADVLLSIGRMLLELDDVDLATDNFLKIVDNDPTNGEAFSMIAKCLLMRDEPEPEGAVQFFEHAINMGYEQAWVVEELTKLHLYYGEAGMAAKTLAKADSKSLSMRMLGVRVRWAKLYNKVLGPLTVKAQMLKGWAKSKYRRFVHRA